MSGVHLHLYGKNTTQSFRKMGHITVTDNDIEKLKEKALLVKHSFRIIS
jgi:5-(carboxyamino)imidazole ribonucleotide synthase